MTETFETQNSNSPWQFQPGESGNPGGRPKSFATLIRKKSLDGEKLVAFAFATMAGKPVHGVKPSPELSFRALEWLADRGWGKAIQNVEHAGQIVHTWDILADLSLEDVKTLALAYRALQEQKAQAIEGESRVLETDEDVSSSQ